MAELQFPDIVGRFQQGQAYGRQVREEDRQRQNQSRLSELAAQAYGAEPGAQREFVQQAIGVDPSAGFALGGELQKQDANRDALLLNSARLFDSAPDALKPQVLQQIAPRLEQYLPGISQAPIEQVSQGVKAFIASRGGGGETRGSVVGNRIVNPVTGDVIYEGPEQPRYFLTDQGLVAVGQDGAREITLGGGTGGQTTTQEAGGRSVDVSQVTDPATRAAILANPDQFAALPGQGETVQVPGVAPGRRLLPAASAADAERLALARDANARAAEAARRADEAAARARAEDERRRKFGTIPPGFRVNAAGTGLEPVPGGPKPAGATATEGERKAATLLQRLRGSQAQLAAAVEENPRAASPSVGASIAGNLPLVGDIAANYANSPERQRVEAAQLDILDAALTLGTGAAYTKEQLEGYRRSYFPQIGDSDATIRDKAARLRNVISSAETAAGRAAAQVPGAVPREITSQAEYDALPSGAVYLEDGQQYRKP